MALTAGKFLSFVCLWGIEFSALHMLASASAPPLSYIPSPTHFPYTEIKRLSLAILPCVYSLARSIFFVLDIGSHYVTLAVLELGM